jgi:Zn-finger nucleic acid-binding protein
MELSCPRCQVALTPRKERPKGVLGCPECLGLWLPWSSFDEGLLERMREIPSVTPDVHGAPADAEDGWELIFCLECARTMDRRIYGETLKIDTEECPLHGVWLDPGELENISSIAQRQVVLPRKERSAARRRRRGPLADKIRPTSPPEPARAGGRSRGRRRGSEGSRSDGTAYDLAWFVLPFIDVLIEVVAEILE